MYVKQKETKRNKPRHYGVIEKLIPSLLNFFLTEPTGELHSKVNSGQVICLQEKNINSAGKKVPSASLGQVDFLAGQVTFRGYFPNK